MVLFLFLEIDDLILVYDWDLFVLWSGLKERRLV